jgi:hypothetical protein
LQIAPKAGEQQRCWVDVKVLHYLYKVVKTIQWVWSLRFQNSVHDPDDIDAVGIQADYTMDAKV